MKGKIGRLRYKRGEKDGKTEVREGELGRPISSERKALAFRKTDKKRWNDNEGQ